MNKNDKLLKSFVAYCRKYPELRFWQALRGWSKADKIYYAFFSKKVDDEIIEDTFYWTTNTPPTL